MQYNNNSGFRQNSNGLNNPMLWVGAGVVLLLLGMFTHKKIFAFAGIGFLLSAIFVKSVDFNNMFSRFKDGRGGPNRSLENYRRKMQVKEEKAKIKTQYKANQRRRKRALEAEEDQYQEQRERRLEQRNGINYDYAQYQAQDNKVNSVQGNQMPANSNYVQFDSNDFVYDQGSVFDGADKDGQIQNNGSAQESKPLEQGRPSCSEPRVMDVFSTPQKQEEKQTGPKPQNKYLFIRVEDREISLCNKEILDYMLNNSRRNSLGDRDVTRLIGEITYNDYLIEHKGTLIPKALVQAVGATSNAVFFFLCTNKQYRIAINTGVPEDAKEIANVISKEIFNKDAITEQQQLATQGRRMENAYKALVTQVKHQTLDPYNLLIKAQEVKNNAN